MSTKISLHGPQGPVSPMAQKLSFSPQRRTRSGGNPDSRTQRSAASSSSRNTVAKRFAGGNPQTPVTSSQADSIASALK